MEKWMLGRYRRSIGDSPVKILDFVITFHYGVLTYDTL